MAWIDIGTHVRYVTKVLAGRPVGFDGTILRRRREAPRYFVQFAEAPFPGAPGLQHWVDHNTLVALPPRSRYTPS
jgi:hypothetical protein